MNHDKDCICSHCDSVCWDDEPGQSAVEALVRPACWACSDPDSPETRCCDRNEWGMMAILAEVRGHRIEDAVSNGCYGLAMRMVRDVFDVDALRRAIARREIERLDRLAHETVEGDGDS